MHGIELFKLALIVRAQNVDKVSNSNSNPNSNYDNKGHRNLFHHNINQQRNIRSHPMNYRERNYPYFNEANSRMHLSNTNNTNYQNNANYHQNYRMKSEYSPKERQNRKRRYE